MLTITETIFSETSVSQKLEFLQKFKKFFRMKWRWKIGYIEESGTKKRIIERIWIERVDSWKTLAEATPDDNDDDDDDGDGDGDGWRRKNELFIFRYDLLKMHLARRGSQGWGG